MKTAIVTGASGFLGCWLISELNERQVSVVAVVRATSNVSELSKFPNVTLVYCDMENIEQLPILVNVDADVFYHLAWSGSTGNDRADYDLQLKNANISVKAVAVAKQLGCTRFVGAGTLAELDCLAYSGEDYAKPATVTAYATAKIASHFFTKAECAAIGIDHIWAYIPNTYGEGNYTQNFVNFATRKMLRGERAAFTSGTQYYDFVYASDTAQGLALIGEKGEAFCAYYIGSAAPSELRDFIKQMRDAVDEEIPLYLGEIPFNGTSQPIETFDCAKLTSVTGYIPKVSFAEGIKNTVTWLKEVEAKR